VPAPSTNVGPRIKFANPVYDFGRIKSGDPVKYTYIFTNVGDQTLELSNVQPQCGCTAAGEWTRKVECGQTGSIPIQFNTASYSQPVTKTITVASNDKTQPVVVLQLKGTVWKPIEFVPPYCVLNILPDMPSASSVVKIINNLEEPLALSSPECSNPSFRAELKTNTPGKEYQVTISAVPPLNPGTVQGKVTLRSSATNTPTVDVPFWANVQAAVMVLPAQIVLPTGPTAGKTSPAVTVQNNTTNALTVSDPSVNITNAEVTIKELQPGRIFTVTVWLPEGFELPPGQKALLTLKTSNPQFQKLEVPIVQMPKPITPVQQSNLQGIKPQGPFMAKPMLKPGMPATLQPGQNVAGTQTNKAQFP